MRRADELEDHTTTLRAGIRRADEAAARGDAEAAEELLGDVIGAVGPSEAPDPGP